jgi:hypothetical protein
MHCAVLSKHSPAYMALTASERMVVCQHSVYAVVVGVSLVPQTIIALTVLYKAWTGAYFVSRQIPILGGLFMGSRMVLYLVEACVRSVIKGSWLLFAHHELFLLLMILALWTQSTTVLGVGIVLDLFACHEAPYYVALYIAYRLRWRASLTCAIVGCASIWYILTRVAQTVMIMYMIIGFAQMSAVKSDPAFIATAVLFGAFTVIQVYTLVIYYAMYRKACAGWEPGSVTPGSSRTPSRSSSAGASCVIRRGGSGRAGGGAGVTGSPDLTIEVTKV